MGSGGSGDDIDVVRPFAVLDAMVDCLAVVDPHGRISYLNAAWRRFDGDAERFRVGGDFQRACADLFEPGHQPTSMSRELDEMLNGRTQRVDLTCRWKAPTGRRYGAVTLSACEVATGRGALVQLVDITERINASAAVQESEARYRSLVDGSPDIVFITDSSSRMIYANRALEDQTGYTAADFQMTQPKNPFIHPDDAPRVAEFIAAFVASDRRHSERIDNRFVTRAGEVLWYSSIISKVQYMGAPALQFVVHNITEQRKAEQESAQRLREAQDAILARDEFLAVAAHELKTPLTSLRGYAQWLARMLSEGTELDPAKQAQALATIDRQTLKLAHLIEQLLDLSRLQAGRLELARRVTDVVSVVTDAVTGARVRSGRAIDLTAPDALAARVDPLRIEQVVTNLVENALKFSPRDTRVDVALREAPDARFEIVVRDRGAGVPAGERPRLFERYFQGDHGLGGMGLGLFLSREIVERHGGTISAEFPASGGTQVVVTIARDLEGGEA